MSTLFVDDINEKTSGNGVMIPGHVVQVLQDTKTDSTSTTSTSFTDISGLAVSITPKAASSKILVTYSVNMSTDDANFAYLRLMRDSTAIIVGDASGTRVQVTSQYYSENNEGNVGGRSFTFLDSPNTTSQVTYKVQFRCATAGTTTINKSFRDSNSTGFDSRTPSTIIVMEIAQ
jgi:hypothetical protein